MSRCAAEAAHSSEGHGLSGVRLGSSGEPAPHRRGPREQRVGEHDDSLRVMSHEVALETREATESEEGHDVLRLREGGTENQTRDVRHALPAVEDGQRSDLPSAHDGVAGPSHYDLAAHRWPVGPGEAQPKGEPPRVTKERAQRRQRMKALGNAVVPHVAYVVGCVVARVLHEVAP